MTGDAGAKKRIIYIADPMCSWCWGFAPVIHALRKTFSDELEVDVVAGGLRPGTSEAIMPAVRESVLHHWHEVERATGQPFRFEDALPDGFVYDTEPPCRALVTVRTMNPDGPLEYLHALHRAFYSDGRDITDAAVLHELARETGVDDGEFVRRFDSEEMRQATLDDFARARGMGINAFPAAVMDDGAKKKLLTLGYLSFNDLQPRVRRWLDGA